MLFCHIKLLKETQQNNFIADIVDIDRANPWHFRK